MDGWYRLAHEFKIPPWDLGKLMRRLTYRQYLAWMDWLDRQQHSPPSRLEYYLMQIAAEIRMGNVKHPQNVEIDHFEIIFKEKKIMSQKQDEQQQGEDDNIDPMGNSDEAEEIRRRSDIAKARWLAHVGPPQTITSTPSLLKD